MLPSAAVAVPTTVVQKSASTPHRRVESIDGLRAVAVLGVLWWHSWIHTSNPELSIGVGSATANLERAFVLLGNGVNLFFVISGFCIYLSLQKTNFDEPLAAYGYFIRRRWLRLSPAFYAACGLSAVTVAMITGSFPVRAMLWHVAWLSDVRPELAAPFWSLETEWEFYLFLPLVLLVSRRLGIVRPIVLLGICCICFRVWILRSEGINSALLVHLPARFCEFGWGVLAADAVQRHGVIVQRLKSGLGVASGLLIAYIGRCMNTTEFANAFPTLSPVIKAFAEPVMTLGFACIIISVVTSVSAARRIFEWSGLQAVGRWSYSIYLIHWWPSVLIGAWALRHFGRTAASHYLALTLVLVVVIPISAAMYWMCERPYLRRGRLG